MSETKQAPQGRVLEIEWMKAVAVIGMVLVHVFEMGINLDYQSFDRTQAAFWLKGLAAFQV